MMFDSYAAIQVLIMSLITIGLRFLPFLIFGENKKTPRYIEYLGKVLPAAIMGMLVIYCLKGIDFLVVGNWVPTVVAVVSVVVLQVWKRQSMISILGGTVIYMILIQLI